MKDVTSCDNPFLRKNQPTVFVDPAAPRDMEAIEHWRLGMRAPLQEGWHIHPSLLQDREAYIRTLPANPEPREIAMHAEHGIYFVPGLRGPGGDWFDAVTELEEIFGPTLTPATDRLLITLDELDGIF